MKKLTFPMMKALEFLKQMKNPRLNKHHGWTYRPKNKFKESTFVALFKRGLLVSCCEAHEGRDAIRISKSGEKFLQS